MRSHVHKRRLNEPCAVARFALQEIQTDKKLSVERAVVA